MALAAAHIKSRTNTMSLQSILKDIENGIEFPFKWLHTNGAQVNTDLAEAQVVLNDGAAVATATGETAAAAALNRASGGLTVVEAGITAETNATNISGAIAGANAVVSVPLTLRAAPSARRGVVLHRVEKSHGARRNSGRPLLRRLNSTRPRSSRSMAARSSWSRTPTASICRSRTRRR